MTEPASSTQAPAAPAQFISVPFAQQAPCMFANHIAVLTDENVVYMTFSQATPIVPPAEPAASGEMQKFQNVPMIALPVARIVFVPKMLPSLIENLQKMAQHLEQQQSP